MSKPIAFITITEDPDDFYGVVVEFHDRTNGENIPSLTERVDLSPEPTWLTPIEANDRLADAVRKVLDNSWAFYTGERLTR